MLTLVCSAKRMYYPQAYHHIQEIQKYNIQDYRPRSVFLQIPSLFHTDVSTGWSSSRKPSAKSDKYNACASSEDTLFRKQTNRRLEYYKPMILHVKEADTVRWLVRGNDILCNGVWEFGLTYHIVYSFCGSLQLKLKMNGIVSKQ